MVDFPAGTPTIPTIDINDTPGGAGGGTGIRTIINTIKTNLLSVIDHLYNRRHENYDPIINGGFTVWNVATSFASIANNTFGPEMFIYYKVGAMVHDLSQSTDVPAASDMTQEGSYSTLIDCTTVDASIAAGDLCGYAHLIEGFQFKKIANREFTIRFWVKATKTGIYCISFKNSGQDRSYVAEYTINSSDTWEEKSITISASNTGSGTWNLTNGTGLRVTWALAAGSTFQTTANAWNTGNFLATANQVNACDNVANNFRLYGVTIKAGKYCPPFQPQSLQKVTLDTQRYYVEMKSSAATQVFSFGEMYNTTGANSMFFMALPVPMRTTPVLVVSNAAHFCVSNHAFQLSNDGTGIAIYSYCGSGYYHFLAFTFVSGSTAFGNFGQATMLLSSGTGGSSARLGANARLS